MFKEYGARKLEHFFEVTETGDYKMCLRNNDANNAVVGTVELQFGEWSPKFLESEAITVKALRPVETHAFQVNTLIGRVRKEISEQSQRNMQLSDSSDSIRTRILVFGLISVAIMGISTYLQVRYLKNFFRHKKII